MQVRHRIPLGVEKSYGVLGISGGVDARSGILLVLHWSSKEAEVEAGVRWSLAVSGLWTDPLGKPSSEVQQAGQVGQWSSGQGLQTCCRWCGRLQVLQAYVSKYL